MQISFTTPLKQSPLTVLFLFNLGYAKQVLEQKKGFVTSSKTPVKGPLRRSVHRSGQ